MTVRVEFGDRSSRIAMWLMAVALIALAAAPYWGGRDDLRLLAEIYAYVALASLWNLLAGYAGLVSVGQQAYVGLGAYVFFALAMLADVPPLWAIPLAGLVAAVASAPVAGRVRAAWVDRQARKGSGPSDHAPVIVDLDQAPDGDIGPVVPPPSAPVVKRGAAGN